MNDDRDNIFNIQNKPPATQVLPIHPTVKEHLGKAPKGIPPTCTVTSEIKQETDGDRPTTPVLDTMVCILA